MAANDKYEKILARKKVQLADAPGQPTRSLGYAQAMELVRSNRRAGNYKLGNYYLQQIAEQINVAPEPAVYLLNVYLDDMRLESAELLADFLRDKFPVDSSALSARARFHQSAAQWNEAEALMLRAIQIYPHNSKFLEVLAELYRSMGDRRRALDYYDKALRIKPDFCEALFGKARLLGANATPEFIAQINSAIDSKKFSGAKLAYLLFAMAAVYANTDIDLHMRYLHEANHAIAGTRSFDVAALWRETENIMYRFRQPVVDALRGLVQDDLKPIFIVGMPRSGTTLLEQIIGSHHQCFPIGESGAFVRAMEDADKFGPPPLDAGSTQAIERCRQYFLTVEEYFKHNRFVVAAGDKRVVDKSMSNCMTLGFILLALPSARIIHLERQPLAVIYSCYEQYFSSGNTFSFNLEWAAEYYKRFATLMAHWKTVFPERILSVRYEHLVRDRASETERILKFCDLVWDPACLEHEKAVGLVTSASDSQVRQPVYQSSVERWKKVEPHLDPAKRALGEWLDYPI